MRIMYLLFSFTTGGTERLVADICNEMVEQKHDVFLYIVNDLYSKEMLDSLNPKVKVELQNRTVGGGGKLKAIFSISSYIRKNKIDIVHCNSFNAPELLLLKSLMFHRTRIVHTIHDVNQYSKLSKSKIQLRNKLCNSFVAISESVKNDIISRGADPLKVFVVYNAINIDKFTAGNKRESGRDAFVIGNVARIMPDKKGQDVLIKAVAEVKKKYPNIRCQFAGEADKAHKVNLEELKKLAYELDIVNEIEFLGNVDNVPAFLEKIDIFVLPSRFEGFGISLIEAMAMGIPCIASNLDGPAEIINKGIGFLFESGNEDELAQKIIYVIENYNKEKKDAEENVSYIRSHYDIKNMCLKLLDVYKNK